MSKPKKASKEIIKLLRELRGINRSSDSIHGIDDDDYGMKMRSEVLHVALLLENKAKKLLGEMLQVDPGSSRMIGHRSDGLSFSQKMTLLMEMGTLDSKDMAPFQDLIEIRNMVLHNIEAKSMDRCCQLIKDKRKNETLRKSLMSYAKEKLSDQAPEDTWGISEQDAIEFKLRVGFSVLSRKVIELDGEITESVLRHRNERLGAVYHRKVFEKYMIEQRDIFKQAIERVRSEYSEHAHRTVTTKVIHQMRRELNEALRSCFDSVRFHDLHLKATPRRHWPSENPAQYDQQEG